MKLTKQQLKQIIKEEISSTFKKALISSFDYAAEHAVETIRGIERGFTKNLVHVGYKLGRHTNCDFSEAKMVFQSLSEISKKHKFPIVVTQSILNDYQKDFERGRSERSQAGQ